MAESLIIPVVELVVSRAIDELVQRAAARWTSTTVSGDDQKRKKLKLEIPGNFKLEHQGKLKIIYEDLENTCADHQDASPGTFRGNPDGSAGEGEGEGEGGESEGEAHKDEDSDREQVNKKRSRSGESSKARREVHSEFSIKTVMALVKACGATPGTKEFFVASEILTKRAEREMFMTLETPQQRYEWLKMKQEKHYP